MSPWRCTRSSSGAWPASPWPGSRVARPSTTSTCGSTPGSTSPAGRAARWPAPLGGPAPRPGQGRSTCAPARVPSPWLSGGPGPTPAIVATDVDPRAVACARANGVEAYRGDLFAPVPPTWSAGPTWWSPWCPTSPRPRCACLPRDTLDLRGRRPLRRRSRRHRGFCTGRHRGARASCVRVARCCSSSAAPGRRAPPRLGASRLRPSRPADSMRPASDEDGSDLLAAAEATFGRPAGATPAAGEDESHRSSGPPRATGGRGRGTRPGPCAAPTPHRTTWYGGRGPDRGPSSGSVTAKNSVSTSPSKRSVRPSAKVARWRAIE